MLSFFSDLAQKVRRTCAFVRTHPYHYLFLSVLGAIHVFAYAPFFLWWLLPISFSGFAWILFEQKNKKQAFQTSVCYFFAMYASTLYWVGHSFSYVNLSWLSPIAYVGLPLIMMLPMAVFSTLAWRLGYERPPITQTIILATSINTVFLLHFLGEFAFPWVLPGYTLPLPLLQTTAWTGIEGLTYITVFAALILFARSKIYTILIITLFAGLAFLGHQRLSHKVPLTPYNMRIVHPNIDQQTKWDPLHTQHNLQIQGDLSQMEGERPIQAVIWPEAAVTFDFTKYPELQKMLGHAAPNGGYVLLGTVREETTENALLPRNSLVALNDQGEIKGIYDKKHLLPFGEYMPFRSIFPFLQKITHGARDFVPGNQSPTMLVDHIPIFRTLICYEAMLSREILPPSGHGIRPSWLLNITNDAWFGESMGPHQHLYHSRVRAIEQGLPMVRCANNGISAVMDPYGRILYRLELNEIGIIDFTLPEALAPTVYHQHGAWILKGLLLLSIVLLMFVSFNYRKKAGADNTPA